MGNRYQISDFQIISAGMNYSQMEIMTQSERDNVKKIEDFKERIKAFLDVTTLAEAKKLAAAILPVAWETNKFNIGSAKCTIINRDDLFRICLDTDNEFISYDFV